LPRTAFTLLAAGALANAASSLYPPFEVIDFLVVPLQPVVGFLAGLSGRTSALAGDANMGVINLADVYLFFVPLLLLAWPLAALAAAGIASRRRVAFGSAGRVVGS
jgi:lipoprotein signal peptidase